jgi:hypothetical protein
MGQQDAEIRIERNILGHAPKHPFSRRKDLGAVHVSSHGGDADLVAEI